MSREIGVGSSELKAGSFRAEKFIITTGVVYA
jgi:hypothetical protein